MKYWPLFLPAVGPVQPDITSFKRENQIDIIMHPTQQSKARLGGGVHYIFLEYSNFYQVTTVALFKVTMFTALISSNGSHFLTAGFLAYLTYKVSS